MTRHLYTSERGYIHNFHHPLPSTHVNICSGQESLRSGGSNFHYPLSLTHVLDKRVYEAAVRHSRRRSRMLRVLEATYLDSWIGKGRRPIGIEQFQILPFFSFGIPFPTRFSLSVENEQAGAGRDGRTHLARPNSPARTGTGKCPFSMFS